MNHVDHPAKMAAQDPDFPDYDERGWPSSLVCAVDELREHAARVREVAQALRSTNALRGDQLQLIAGSLETAAGSAECYMAETAGPGLRMQVELASAREPGFVKPDNDHQVFFYEQDFYVLSNFSAFNLAWSGLVFPTSEHCYHWLKFNRPGDDQHDMRATIRLAPSAHEAFKIAERNKHYRRSDWDEVKVGLMLDILRAKAAQHEYVRRKLLATGDRDLIEDSWRDPFWGWGPNRDGQNMLGKLWMQVRAELRAAA